jgi:hypothetical protein
MSAWRHPAAVADASINFDFVKATALKAEEGKLDFYSLPTVSISTRNRSRIF